MTRRVRDEAECGSSPAGDEPLLGRPAGSLQAARNALRTPRCEGEGHGRRRSSDPNGRDRTRVERQQLKWFAASVTLSVTCFAAVALPIGPLSLIGWLGGLLAISLVPIAIGSAIMRYRLWDIDRIISRTLAYAAVTGILALVLTGAILLFQTLLAPLTGGSTIAVAASTLVVAALFQSLRGRVQGAVDRRFDRSRYDGERLALAFASRLRDQVELATVRGDLVATVGASPRPTSIGSWIREHEGPR